MDPRIINDAFEKEPHICAFCECIKGNHLVFHRCPLFENNPICEEDCRISMMKEDVEAQVSAKLGKPVTKEFINQTCKNCGLNNACQNQKLAEKLENSLPGDFNGPQSEAPRKTR
jgi:hypothetical protein